LHCTIVTKLKTETVIIKEIYRKQNVFSSFQTVFSLGARNQFSCSLTLAAEIGLLKENLFSGFQTGFGTKAQNQFSHSLTLAAEIGLLGKNLFSAKPNRF